MVANMNIIKFSNKIINLKSSKLESSQNPLKIIPSALKEDDVRPIGYKNIMCPCLKFKRKLYISKFESIYEKTMDIRNIFIKLKELNFINKLFLSKNQRNLAKLALHKTVVKKSLGFQTKYNENQQGQLEKTIKSSREKSALFTIDKFEDLVRNIHKNQALNLNFDEKLLMFFE
jgi:hypothetical protein